MSAATEYAPTVYLPAQRALALVPTGDGYPPAVSPVPPRARELPDVRVLHRPSAPPLAAPLRLTRRGVVVLSAVVAAVGGVLLWAAAASGSASGGAGAPAPHVHAVTVAPGDTLWSIAGRVAPGRDPRAEVALLQRRNHLSGVDLTPGQRLTIS